MNEYENDQSNILSSQWLDRPACACMHDSALIPARSAVVMTCLTGQIRTVWQGNETRRTK